MYIPDNAKLKDDEYIIIKRNQVCPVCGTRPIAHKMSGPWEDWLCVCPECDFSYSMLGDFGDTEEDAYFIWDYDVTINGLDCVTLSAKDNEKESIKWKEKREWYSQRNKNKD